MLNSIQEWLNRHGPFDAVIDAANVGLYKQHNFSFFQVRTFCIKCYGPCHVH